MTTLEAVVRVDYLMGCAFSAASALRYVEGPIDAEVVSEVIGYVRDQALLLDYPQELAWQHAYQFVSLAFMVL